MSMRKLLLPLLPFAVLATSKPALGQATWASPINYLGDAAGLSAPAPGVVWSAYNRYFVRGTAYSTLYQSTNDGQTFSDQTVGSTAAGGGEKVADICALSSQVAWVLRTSFVTGAAPSLLATSTGPAGFALKNAQLPANFSTIHFFTATTGVAVATPASGASTWPLYQTTDGGATWQLLANSPAIASGATTIIQKFAVGNSLWFSTDKGDVLRSSNLGQTWTLTPGLGKVVFEDELHGLAYTSSSSGQQLARTADGGLTWVPLTFSGQPLFTELAAIPGQPGTYLSVGSQQVSGPPTTWPTYNGVTGISHDRGATWTTLAPVNYQFQHVVASATQVWATGIDLPDGIPVGHLLRFTGSVLAAKPRADASLAWYPNPTTGPLQLAGTLPGAVAVRVYNAVGQLCQAGQLAGPAPRLDLSALPAGLYQVVLQAADGSLRTQQVLCAH